MVMAGTYSVSKEDQSRRWKYVNTEGYTGHTQMAENTGRKP